jgi:hypothetical protein
MSCSQDAWSGPTCLLAPAWFIVVSLVYVVMVGFFGGYSYEATHDYWLRQPALRPGLPNFTGPTFVTGFILWGTAVFLLQAYRVFASIRRSHQLRFKLSRGFWNLQTWVQFKVLLLLLAIPFLTWLVRKIGG